MITFRITDINGEYSPIDIPEFTHYYDSIVWSADDFPHTFKVAENKVSAESAETHITTQWSSHFFKSGTVKSHLKGYRDGKVEYETSHRITLYDRDFLGLEWGAINLQKPTNLTAYCLLDRNYEYKLYDIVAKGYNPYSRFVPVNHKLLPDADFRKAVYTMIQKFLPIEMQLTYQVDGEPLERLPDGYSDHYVLDGFEMDDAQKFERAENFLHVYSSKETEESYTVRCSIIQPGQQSLFDNEYTVYETVKVGEADGVLGTSTDEHGKNVYTLSWEHRGITHTVMGNIPYDEIMKIAEGIR